MPKFFALLIFLFYSFLCTATPTVPWSTYFGGSDYDDLRDVAVGKDGCIYAIGATSSTTGIATADAYHTSFSGGTGSAGSDALLCKFSSDGTLVWATYYGGSGTDVGKSITCDTAGNIYLAGWTNSDTGIATSGSYQASRASAWAGADRFDAFLVKFDTSGQRLWGTYIGGSNDAYSTNPLAVTADAAGRIIMAMATESTDMAISAGAYQGSNAGAADAYLIQFNSGGQRQWATYYGGPDGDYPYSIATDLSGNIVLAGRTQSSSGIATVAAQQSAIAGGQDAFLVKFDGSGQRLWGTYYGGPGLDRAYSVAVDDSANIYIGGITNSATGIATVGTHQTVFGGSNNGDGFVGRFNAAGQRQWGTYYGGPAGDNIWGMFCNGTGALYVTGTTQSSDSMATTGAVQPAYGGVQDAFISRIDAGSGNLVWGSYYGGIDGDAGWSVSGSGTSVYFVGSTFSATGIATAGSYQSGFGGGTYDGFLTRVNDCELPPAPDSIVGPASVCAGTSYVFSVTPPLTTTYNWLLPPGWTGNSNVATITVVFNDSSGAIGVVAGNTCGVSDTTFLTVTVNPAPDAPEITQDGGLLHVATVYATYQWNLDGQPIVGATGPSWLPQSDGSYTVTVSNAGDCIVTSAAWDLTTGIPGVNVHQVKIFPNPAQREVYLDLPFTAFVALYESDGTMLLRSREGKGLQRLDISGLHAGIYHLIIFNEKGNVMDVHCIVKI